MVEGLDADCVRGEQVCREISKEGGGGMDANDPEL